MDESRFFFARSIPCRFRPNRTVMQVEAKLDSRAVFFAFFFERATKEC
jgi:hypothetical protein